MGYVSFREGKAQDILVTSLNSDISQMESMKLILVPCTGRIILSFQLKWGQKVLNSNPKLHASVQWDSYHLAIISAYCNVESKGCYVTPQNKTAPFFSPSKTYALEDWFPLGLQGWKFWVVFLQNSFSHQSGWMKYSIDNHPLVTCQNPKQQDLTKPATQQVYPVQLNIRRGKTTLMPLVMLITPPVFCRTSAVPKCY